MELCRACLATEKGLLPLDEAFVIAYNLLTNLNVSLLDAMPQYVCQTCSDSVKSYLEFREKCITTETSLQEVILKREIFEEDKPLSQLKNTDIKIKEEVKEEETDCFVYDDTNFDAELFQEIKRENYKDIKPKKRKHKKKKCKRICREKKSKPTSVLNVKSSMLSCGLCEKTFKETLELSDHVEGHKNNLYCGRCPMKFKYWCTLVGHRFTHIPKNEYRCHICRKRLSNGPLNMEFHYMKDHDGEKHKFKCEFCERLYETPRKMKKHINHSHSEKVFICDYCNKLFHNKQQLKTHIKCHSEDKSYVCELCGFASKHYGGLKDHIIRKHSPEKVKCAKCIRMFATPADRDRHVCQIIPRMCPVCGLNLTLPKNYTRHMQMHSSVKRYKCTRCPIAYKTKGALIAHTNRHDNVRPFQCQYCPMKFFTANVLSKHKRVHTGEKPYVCKVCNKGFTGNHNLKVHMRVHGEYLVVKRSKTEDAPLSRLPLIS